MSDNLPIVDRPNSVKYEVSGKGNLQQYVVQAPDGTLHLRTEITKSTKRHGFEGSLKRRVTLRPEGFHAAHNIGAGFGRERKQGIYWAPAAVNLEYQNSGIEDRIRELNKLKKDRYRLFVKIEATTVPGTRVLKEINYELELVDTKDVSKKPVRVYTTSIEIDYDTKLLHSGKGIDAVRRINTPPPTKWTGWDDIEDYLKPANQASRGTANPANDNRMNGPANRTPRARKAPITVKVDEIIEVSNGNQKFKISISNKYPRTIALLKLGGGFIFSMVLNAVAARFREHLQKKAAGILFTKVLEKPEVQQAIEEALVKEEHLKTRGDIAFYLLLQVNEIWLGSYDKDGDAVDGLEAPIEFNYHGVVSKSTISQRTCRVKGFWTEPNYPEGINFKRQICSYPIMINREAVEKVEFEKSIERTRIAWEACVRQKNYRPAGLPSPEEVAQAEIDCAKEVGFSLATLGMRNKD